MYVLSLVREQDFEEDAEFPMVAMSRVVSLYLLGPQHHVKFMVVWALIIGVARWRRAGGYRLSHWT
jgi:hypothetical protein